MRNVSCATRLNVRSATVLENKWKTYPSVSQVWRRNWARITPFFNYPLDIRKAVYTTNSVESLTPRTKSGPKAKAAVEPTSDRWVHQGAEQPP